MAAVGKRARNPLIVEPTDPLIAHLNRCVVQIYCDGNFKGTGFFIGRGKVLTCAHSVVDASLINIVAGGKEFVSTSATPVDAVARAKSNPYNQPDAVILNFDERSISDHSCVRLESTEPALGHDQLILSAFARGENDPNQVARSGVILSLESLFEQSGHVLYKFAHGQVIQGFSGGPILNARTGCVCAMVDSSRSTKSDLGGFGVPIGLIDRAIPGLLSENAQFHSQDREWSRAMRLANQQAARREHRVGELSYAGADERRVMLRRIYNKWFRDADRAVEEFSSVQIFLGRRVESAGRMNIERPTSEPLINFFEDSGGAVVLVGGPGSGKTTLLVELTRHLVDQSERRVSSPIPILLNLSSWQGFQSSLDEWVTRQLDETYSVPHLTTKRWLAENRLILVLDGLDEVSQTRIQSCVDAISRHLRVHGPTRVVVACQETTYDSLEVPLDGDVVVIQDLTADQVGAALGPIGVEMADAVKRIETAFGQIRSPLMLNIVQQTLRGGALDQIDADRSEESAFGDLLGAYVDRMLRRRVSLYTYDDTMRWLRFLATSMRIRGLNEFQIDRISPDWIWADANVRVALLMASIIGLSAGLIDGVGYGLVHGAQRGVGNGIVIGLLFAFFVGLRVYEIGKSVKAHQRGVGHRYLLAFMAGSLLSVASATLLDLQSVVVFGPFFFVAYLVFGRFASLGPVEQVSWEPRRSIRGVLVGFGVGAVIGLVDGLRGGHSSAFILLGYVLGFGFSVAIFGGLAMGLRPRLVTDRIRPNEGVYRSLRRAAMYGGAAAVLGVATFGLSFELLSGGLVSFGASVRLASVLGMGAALLGGGLYVVEHLIARLLFFGSGKAPLDYVRFLDDVSARLLLRRVGSGYVFQHGSVLTYLVNSSDSSSAK